MISESCSEETSVLILDNVPPGTEVGIDYHSWYTGPKFKGISNIPPGFHFVFFSSVDKFNEKSPRSGFFLFLKGGEFIAKKYDKANEDMTDAVAMDIINQYHDDNNDDIRKYFAPYPSKECEKWCSLVDCISHDLVERIQPVCGKIDFLTQVPMDTAGKQRKSIRNIDSRVEDVTDERTVLRFTKLPYDLPDDITPQEISKLNLDSTYFLLKYIDNLPNGDQDVLGELQFAFITFLIGQVYDCFDHWKLIIAMLTNCYECLSSKTSLFSKFIDTISIQMDEIPEDYFLDITVQQNFLLSTFKSFFQNFDHPDEISGGLLKKVSLFKHRLHSHFGWDLDGDDDEEDMPVIVEL